MRVTQTRDFGLSKESLTKYLVDSDYWATDALRERNAFVLSPSVYVLSAHQEKNLSCLARHTYGAVEVLNQYLCALEGVHKHPKEGRFLKLANTASRGLLRPADGIKAIPPILKVDLVQDECGGYQIAEVDAYNPRGLGYIALMKGAASWEVSRGGPGRLFGSMSTLADYINAAGDNTVKTWLCIVSAFERYYETSFQILSRTLRTCGIDLRIIRDAELMQNIALLEREDIGVFMIPESLYELPQLRDVLVEKYREGSLKMVYPPVAYLGSKAFLPFLSDQDGMGAHVPRTALIGKSMGDPFQRVRCTVPTVLKATVSSGMKQVYFSDLHPDCFAKTLESAARQKNPAWVLQEQVAQKPIPVIVFDDVGEKYERDYFLRVVAYISRDGILDVCVTGRPDRMVHGAPDCIMLPVVREA